MDQMVKPEEDGLQLQLQAMPKDEPDTAYTQLMSGPPSSPPPPGFEGRSDAEGRPLNVTDALSYLDAVKKQFEDKPDVYNNFLDIMKDFKSQACVFVVPSFGSRCSDSLCAELTPQALLSAYPTFSRGITTSYKASTRFCHQDIV